MSSRITGMQHVYRFLTSLCNDLGSFHVIQDNWNAALVSIFTNICNDLASRITGMQRLYRTLQAYVTIWDHFMSSRITWMQRLCRFAQAYITRGLSKTEVQILVFGVQVISCRIARECLQNTCVRVVCVADVSRTYKFWRCSLLKSCEGNENQCYVCLRGGSNPQTQCVFHRI